MRDASTTSCMKVFWSPSTIIAAAWAAAGLSRWGLTDDVVHCLAILVGRARPIDVALGPALQARPLVGRDCRLRGVTSSTGPDDRLITRHVSGLGVTRGAMGLSGPGRVFNRNENLDPRGRGAVTMRMPHEARRKRPRATAQQSATAACAIHTLLGFLFDPRWNGVPRSSQCETLGACFPRNWRR